MTSRLKSQINHWCFQVALPYWAANGLDTKMGGYVERFSSEGNLPFWDVKRVRVLARQLYVFSHAAILGFEDGHRCAKHGFDFLTRYARSENEHWIRQLNRNGTINDPTPDLYDQAFVLFALAWYYRTSNNFHAIELANQTLDMIDRSFRAPAGGFWHELPATGHRQQNPHMHLLEATLALYEACPDERYAQLAKEIIELFRTRFCNLETGVLYEFFDYSLKPVKASAGRIVEPGHQFEWAWILVKAGHLLGMDLGKEARALTQSAETYGVDQKTGVTFQQVRDDGAALDQGSRTWPNTERLKAAAAMYELDGTDPLPVFEQSCAILFSRHLNRNPNGCWTEKFDENGEPCDGDVPASTFYHVFLAFSEVTRILDMIEATPNDQH